MRSTAASLFLLLLLPTTATAAAPHFVVDSWGPDGQGPGEFFEPHDVDVDNQGNVYVADTGNRRIQKLSQDGRFMLSWGGRDVFQEPTGIALGTDGTCWVLDSGTREIMQFDLYGNWISTRAVPPAPSQSGDLSAIDVAPNGNVMVLDPDARGVFVLSQTGDFLWFWPIPGSGFAEDLAVGPTGETFILDYSRNTSRVILMSTQGFPHEVWHVTTEDGEVVGRTAGLDVSDAGEVYLLATDPDDHRVYRYTRSGRLLSRSWLPPLPPLLGLAVDWTENLWVTQAWPAASIIHLAPPPTATHVLQSASVPGYRFEVRIVPGSGRAIYGAKEGDCIAETLCVSGAIPGRSELLVRVVGPKPNGMMWPTLVKFSTSTIEVWAQQISTGALRYYRLPGAAPGVNELPGLFDRQGFDP